MKKFALYIGLAILLLAVINILRPAEKHIGLGNNPGNTLNGGDVSAFYAAENTLFFKLHNDGFYHFDVETRKLTKLED